MNIYNLDELQDRFFKFYDLDNHSNNDNAYFGSVSPFNGTDFVIDFFDWWVYAIDEKLDFLEEWGEEYTALFSERGFTFEEFKLVFSNKTKPENYDNERVFDYLYITDQHAQDVFISKYTNEENDLARAYTRSIKEHITYQISFVFEFFFEKILHTYISTRSLSRHLYLLAKSGSGKSELLKLIFYDLQRKSAKNRDKSLIVLAPESDLTTEVLRFKLNEGKDMKRVIFLDLDIRQTIINLTGEDLLKEPYNFCINPFDKKDVNRDNVGVYRHDLQKAFLQIIDDVDASKQMGNVVSACIEVLLLRKKSTIMDLIDFMDNNRNEKLIAEGMKHQNEVVRRFIEILRDDKDFARTKKGIMSRLLGLTMDERFRDHLDGKSTIYIGDEIDEGKVIIANFAKGQVADDSANSFGKLLLATIQSAVKRRGSTHKGFRMPTYLFIDEFQNYVNNSISELMAETRKYGLSAILSHQVAGQKMKKNLADEISGNTAIKIGGESDAPTRSYLTKELKGIKDKDFETLKKYSFFVYDSNNKERGTKVLDVPDYLVGEKGGFYMDKMALKKYFEWLVYQSGFYVKTTVKEDRKTNLSDFSDGGSGGIIYNPEFKE